MQRTVNEERNHQALHSMHMRTPKEESGSFTVVPGTLLSSLITRHGGHQRCAADFGFNGDHLRLITNWRRHATSVQFRHGLAKVVAMPAPSPEIDTDLVDADEFACPVREEEAAV